MTSDEHEFLPGTTNPVVLRNLEEALVETRAKLHALQHAHEVLEKCKGFSADQMPGDHSACNERLMQLKAQFEANVRKFNEQLHKAKNEISKKEKEIDQKNKEIWQKQSEVWQKQSEIYQKQNQMNHNAGSNGDVQGLALELAKAREEIEMLKKELGKRNDTYYAAMISSREGAVGQGTVTLAVLEAERVRVAKEITQKCEAITKKNEKKGNELLLQEKQMTTIAKEETKKARQAAEDVKIQNEELRKEVAELKENVQQRAKEVDELREKARQREQEAQPMRSQPLASSSPSVKKRKVAHP